LAKRGWEKSSPSSGSRRGPGKLRGNRKEERPNNLQCRYPPRFQNNLDRTRTAKGGAGEKTQKTSKRGGVEKSSGYCRPRRARTRKIKRKRKRQQEKRGSGHNRLLFCPWQEGRKGKKKNHILMGGPSRGWGEGGGVGGRRR